VPTPSPRRWAVLALSLVLLTATGCTGGDDDDPSRRRTGDAGRFGPLLEAAVLPALATLGARRVAASDLGRAQRAAGVGLEGGYRLAPVPADVGSWCVESSGDRPAVSAVAGTVEGRTTVSFFDVRCPDVDGARAAAVTHPRLDTFEVLFEPPLVQGDSTALRRDLAAYQRGALDRARRSRVEYDAFRVARSLEQNGQLAPRNVLLDPVKQREFFPYALSPDSIVARVTRRGSGWRTCVVDSASRAWALYDSGLAQMVGAGTEGPRCRRIPGFD
jgi:hypothetical protein